MTTSNNAFFATYLIAIVGLFASVGYELATPEAAAAPQAIVKLEPVVITGKRAEATQVVAQLPRVVITGRRNAHADGVQVASL